MSRKKKSYRGTYTYGTGPERIEDPNAGDAFYITFELIEDFFLTEGGCESLLEIMRLRRRAAQDRAKTDGKIIKRVVVSSPEGLGRIEMRCMYE